MKPKVIKTEAEYKAALARIEEIFDAQPGTAEGDELELLSTLVELYEDKAFPMDLPDPITAIKFRMEQQGLKPKDLVPIIGSASKVSEVLSGRRGLSLSMIRNLVNELGIPPQVFVQRCEPPEQDEEVAWHKFPITEMAKRRWFPGFDGTASQAKQRAPELLGMIMKPLGQKRLCPAVLRHRVRGGSTMDPYALMAWRIRVESLAINEPLPAYQPGTVTEKFVRELAKLSYLNEGVKLAKEFLNKSGIHFVVERHLPKTFLDGAAIRLKDGSPLIALTLRFDRLDNFWYTLAHECAHIALHLEKNDIDAFFDDLVSKGSDRAEKEADEFACEALIPESLWRKAGLTAKCNTAQVRAFAEKLRISPAIPAGRIRFERGDYKLCSHLVGSGQVRRWFEQNKEQEKG